MVSPLALVRRLLWNADERRPRAPVRLVVTLVVVVLTLVASVFALQTVGLVSPIPAVFRGVVFTVLSGVSTVVVLVLLGWFVDRRRLTDFGLSLDRDWWIDLGFGLFLGAALLSVVFGLELALGWVVVTGTFSSTGSFLSGFVAIVTLFLIVGVQEELLARGYVLTNVCEGLYSRLGTRGSTTVAVAVSSALFGVAHLGNPNATLVSTLSISLAGVMLAAGYVLTGELAIPIGVHITWNLFQGAVYGFPVSGLGIDVSVVAISQRGPDLWTGGAFGPEAGLLGIAAILLGTLATVGYVRARYRRVAIHPSLTLPDLRWRD